MTIKQLITELEKPRKNYPQGVLTWERGDILVYGTWAEVVTDIGENICGNGILYYHQTDDKYEYPIANLPIKNCTHSADDPRLLGRVILALERIVRIEHIGWTAYCIGCYVEETNKSYVGEGDTLIEAALKALLAKVEGEKK